MSVAKVIELTSTSREGFEHAIRAGVQRAGKTIDNVRSAWIKDQSVTFKNGKIDEFRVIMKVTFVIDDR